MSIHSELGMTTDIDIKPSYSIQLFSEEKINVDETNIQKATPLLIYVNVLMNMPRESQCSHGFRKSPAFFLVISTHHQAFSDSIIIHHHPSVAKYPWLVDMGPNGASSAIPNHVVSAISPSTSPITVRMVTASRATVISTSTISFRRMLS